MTAFPQIFQVDAFTDQPFGGNPAAVCLLEAEPAPSWMQALAREMNLSETAFLWPGDQGFHLRWFTPAVEVKLCGHATLASAHVLWETETLSSQQPARFQTRSGLLGAAFQAGEIVLDFPAHPVAKAQLPPEVAEFLSAEIRFVGRVGEDLLVELGSEEELRALAPNFALLSSTWVRGWIFTSASSTPGFDFVSRFFAPSVGVDEDPVTGSAHCALGPYWSAKTGREDLLGYQASKRGGSVRVQTLGDRVLLSGRAVTIFQGALCLPPKKLEDS